MTLLEPGAAATERRTAALDIARVRQDFPILTREVHGKPLVYLDSAASAQKPRQVIEAMDAAMAQGYANVHRGAHYLSQTLTDRYEGVRESVARFINAGSDQEIVFTRNATESINLVAHSFGSRLTAGDEIVLSEMEHHANIVPWQLLRERSGVVLKIVPITDDGVLRMDAYEALLGPKTRLVAIAHVSNVLGTVNSVREIVRLAHARSVPVLLDGSQAVVHGRVDVRDIDADFYAFTGHKLYGPTAIGVLYGKAELLQALPPFLGGGDMIRSVSFEKTTFAPPPQRFEAGTPPIVEAIGLAAAIDYVESLGMEAIAAHEQSLLSYANQKLAAIDGLTLQGTAPGKCGIVSFTMAQAHPHDIGTIVDRAGVALRAGHHCAQPLMQRLGLTATARASFGLYNTREEIDALADALATVAEIFG
jgi:cysteine desulfurase/selenocysteine lyase